MFGHWAGVLVHLLLLICNSLGFGTDNSINTVVRNVLRNYQNDAEKKQINEAKRNFCLSQRGAIKLITFLNDLNILFFRERASLRE